MHTLKMNITCNKINKPIALTISVIKLIKTS